MSFSIRRRIEGLVFEVRTEAATHALKLDYRALQATFYGEAVDSLLDEHVVADLSFVTRKRPNNPLMAGQIGNMPFIVSWDTGQYGGLYTTEGGQGATRARWKIDAFGKQP